MKLIWKIVFVLTAIVACTASYVSMRDDGGMWAVLHDEAPQLATQWSGRNGNAILGYAMYVPATIGVAAGFRAGNDTFDKSGPLRGQLTAGIPLHLQDDIMRHDSLSAAQRARDRHLFRMASTNTEQVFHQMFLQWWHSHTYCMLAADRYELMQSLAPSLTAWIDSKNIEFSALAEREANGTLTVGERAAYLADPLHVPHVVQLLGTSGDDILDWVAIDLTNQSTSRQYNGPVIAQCPNGDRDPPAIFFRFCRGYVNANIYQRIGYPNSSKTVFSSEVYFGLEDRDETIEFVLEMMEDENKQFALRAQAEQNFNNSPADKMNTFLGELGIQVEYERLRCQQ